MKLLLSVFVLFLVAAAAARAPGKIRIALPENREDAMVDGNLLGLIRAAGIPVSESEESGFEVTRMTTTLIAHRMGIRVRPADESGPQRYITLDAQARFQYLLLARIAEAKDWRRVDIPDMESIRKDAEADARWLETVYFAPGGEHFAQDFIDQDWPLSFYPANDKAEISDPFVRMARASQM